MLSLGRQGPGHPDTFAAAWGEFVAGQDFEIATAKRSGPLGRLTSVSPACAGFNTGGTSDAIALLVDVLEWAFLGGHLHSPGPVRGGKVHARMEGVGGRRGPTEERARVHHQCERPEEVVEGLEGRGPGARG